MEKKASSEMWWIIIGAVIALVVMVILMVMFTGKSGKLETGLSECLGKGGKCVKDGGCSAIGGLKSTAFDCPQSTEPECCFTTKKSANEVCQNNNDCISGSCIDVSVGNPGKCN